MAVALMQKLRLDHLTDENFINKLYNGVSELIRDAHTTIAHSAY